MRITKINRNLKKYDTQWFYNFIKSYKYPKYHVNEETITILSKYIENSISKNNLKLVYYIIYQILISDELIYESSYKQPN